MDAGVDAAEEGVVAGGVGFRFGWPGGGGGEGLGPEAFEVEDAEGTGFFEGSDSGSAHRVVCNLRVTQKRGRPKSAPFVFGAQETKRGGEAS